MELLATDTETTGLDLKHGAKPFFVSTCDEDQNQLYWEWAVNPLTREPAIPEKDLIEIKTLFKNKRMVLHNSRFDVEAFGTIDEDMRLNWDWDNTEDTLMAGHLLASNEPHDLTTMAQVYLGINVKGFEDDIFEACTEARKIAKKKYPGWAIAKVGRPDMPSAKGKVWKFDMWLPRAIASAEGYDADHPWFTLLQEYANADTAVTMALWMELVELLEKRELRAIYESRMKLLPVIMKMKNRGVTANRARIHELYSRFEEETGELEQVCINLSNGRLDQLPKGSTSNSLRETIFEELELESPKKTQAGKPSMDKFVLDHWIATLPPRSKQSKFVRSLRDYRKRSTAMSYLESYQGFGRRMRGKLGRNLLQMFPDFNPTGTDTLRWSSRNPNAQQISKQEGVNLRYVFGPSPGREWWSLDYNNLELRIPAYEAEETEMIQLFEKPDEPPFFGSNHLLVFSVLHPDKYDHDDPEGLLKAKKKYASTWYQWTKNGNFAVQYGAVKESGTADRAYHVDGAQAIIEKRFSNIGKLNRAMIDHASKWGFVETIPDKEVDPDRGYPLYCGKTIWGGVKPTLPLNYRIQGSACWVTSMAMVNIQELFDELNRRVKHEAYFLIMNVHDEVVLDFPYLPNKGNLPIVEQVQKIMERRGDLIGIPLTCGIEYHPNNWSQSE